MEEWVEEGKIGGGAFTNYTCFVLCIFYSDIITFHIKTRERTVAPGNDLGKCIYSKVLKTQDLIFFLRYGRVPNVGEGYLWYCFGQRGSSLGLSKVLETLVFSSCLDIHIPTFRLCFFFSVLLGVCVSVCVYMGRGVYIYACHLSI